MPGELWRTDTVHSLPVFDDIRDSGINDLHIDVMTTPEGKQAVTRSSLLAALGLLPEVKPIDESDESVIHFECGLTLLPLMKIIKINNAQIPDLLSPTEFDVLTVIASAARQAVTRKDIYNKIWKDVDDNIRRVDVNVSRVREKLGVTMANHTKNRRSTPGPNEGLIETVRGIGYIMGDRAYDPTPLVFPF